MHMTRKNFFSRASALGAMAALALTACGSPNTQTTQNVQTSPSASTSASATPALITEGKGAASRVALTYDGGVLIYKDGTFTKVTNPEDPYSRSGNQAGQADSQYVLADYKTDKDAKLERPEKFSIIDTVAATRTVYSLPSGVSYTFRSLARGPKGEALLLTTDGRLRVFDPATGTELGSVQLMEAWTESETWQDERPALWVDGKTTYVTDPATKKLIAVSLSNPAAPKELMSVELPKTPNEILGVSSSKPAPVEAEAHGAEFRSSESSSASAEAHEGHSH